MKAVCVLAATVVFALQQPVIAQDTPRRPLPPATQPPFGTPQRRGDPKSPKRDEPAPQPGAVSPTDLDATCRRVNEFTKKLNAVYEEAEKMFPRNRFNAIQDRENQQKKTEWLAQAESATKKEIEQEFKKLYQKELAWNWPVANVADHIQRTADGRILVVPGQPGQTGVILAGGGGRRGVPGNANLQSVHLIFDANYLEISRNSDPLIVGQHIPAEIAKELKPGDNVLIKGKADALRVNYRTVNMGGYFIELHVYIPKATAERGTASDSKKSGPARP